MDRSLQDRNPNVRRISVPEGQNSPEYLYSLIAPYLGWTLAEVDTLSSDILLYLPDNQAVERVVILTGPLANIWLAHQHKPSTSVDNPS